LNNPLPYKLRITGRLGLIILFFIQGFNTWAQVNPTYDLQKPKAFENRKLASELTPEKKINPFKRAKQNIVTHYNFHFNARNKLEKVIGNAKIAHQDTFTQLLTVFNYSLNNTAQQQQELDSVILKCNNGILLHDLRNDWVDDLYLLMGKSYFYQKKFDSAYDVFQYINYNFQPREKDEAGMEKSIGSNLNNSGNVYTVSSKEKKISPHQSVRNDALLWIAKTLLEQGQTDEARGMLETLSRDKLFPGRLYYELSETRGDWFYRIKQYDSAASYLKKSISGLDNNGEKSRRYYLIAQLLVLAGQNETADSSFEKAVSLTTNPVMDAYAKISQIGLASAGKDKETRLSENIDALMAMAKKEKYTAYRGIIYAAAAEMEKSRNRNPEAISLLIKSNEALINDVNAKNTNSIAIAELAFESKDYPLAKRYFDSSNITGHIREKQMNIKKSVVTDLVKFLNEVAHEDSLQKIA
jgi:tetratricopeptide (TPR) repeat protein